MSQGESSGVGNVADANASPRVEYHEGSQTYRSEFDTHTRPVSEAVFTVVAVATATDPLDLPPIYSVVDPDALNALFAPAPADRSGVGGTVSFDYADCRVTVKRRGTVLVESSDVATRT